MRQDIRITRIEAAPGATIAKRPSYPSGTVFAFPVVYTLADGTQVTGTESARLKRDAVAALAALPREPRNMSACFDDTGAFWGTSTVYGPLSTLPGRTP